MADHPSSLLLDRMVASELQGVERAAVDDHLSSCVRCRAAVDERRQYMAALLARRPPAAFVAQLLPRQTRHRPWWPYAAGLGVTVALLLVVVRPPRTSWRGAGMLVERVRAGAAHAIDTHDRLRAGDVLRVVARLNQGADAMVWLVDGDGRIDPLLDAPLPLPAGESLLPHSMIVDSPCRNTWVVLLVGASADPTALEQLRMRIGRGVGVGVGVEIPDWLPAGAVVQLLRCE